MFSRDWLVLPSVADSTSVPLRGITWSARGLDAVMSHGEKFIEERLAPADSPNDGKQTPMRNHPIFVAQHGTATCCRGCLEK